MVEEGLLSSPTEISVPTGMMWYTASGDGMPELVKAGK